MDLDLTVEGDLNIVMAFAEKLRGGLHSFVFGKPFYTSVQERDALLSFWLRVPALWMMDGRRTRATVCIVPVSHECMHMWGHVCLMLTQSNSGLAFEDFSQASYCYFCNEPLQILLYSFISFKGHWAAFLKRYSVLNIRVFFIPYDTMLTWPLNLQQSCRTGGFIQIRVSSFVVLLAFQVQILQH